MIALALTLAGPAAAGDAALLDVIGYSGDGRYFAFEEFGVQDGSGFAFSNIYIVDLPSDKWMYGSPFHAQATDATYDRPLAEVRSEARGKADERLRELGIVVPADTLILLGDGVADAGKEMAFATPNQPGRVGDQVHGLALATFAAEASGDCESFLEDKPLGFALTYVAPGGAKTVVHRDGARLPRSRGCPMDYRLYAVVEPFMSEGARVAIVSSYPFGFEGPDRRFLAVPLPP